MKPDNLTPYNPAYAAHTIPHAEGDLLDPCWLPSPAWLGWGRGWGKLKPITQTGPVFMSALKHAMGGGEGRRLICRG
jgi:hypothetical protein